MRQNKCARHRDRTETAKIYKSNPRLYLFDSAQPHTPTYSTWELRTNKPKENLATKNVTTTPTPMSTILEESIDRKALRAYLALCLRFLSRAVRSLRIDDRGSSRTDFIHAERTSRTSERYYNRASSGGLVNMLIGVLWFQLCGELERIVVWVTSSR